ncbi:hypothetical protein EDD15DRAFT_2154532, partial [Pisolithus albus]
HTYQYEVKMTCGGCSGAVSRALDKLKDQAGVESYEVSLEKQEVTVRGTATYDFVLEKIKKTGKEVSASNHHRHGPCWLIDVPGPLRSHRLLGELVKTAFVGWYFL